MKKNISVILSLMMVLSLVACDSKTTPKAPVQREATTTMLDGEMTKASKGNVAVKKIFDYVFEVPVYNSIDYKNAEEFIANNFDGWDGACTAVAKYTDDNKMIVGRNMDLYYSNKPAYIIKTKVDGDYETMGISYFNKISDDYKNVLENGITSSYQKIAPFLCTDVFNEKGLYIETNMRNGEYWATGATEYGCSGTNPSSKERVCSMTLPRYIGQHCATVKEAVEYVKTLDIYTPDAKGMDWNFCFMLADANGDYGILEIAQNEVSWLEKQPAQSNFYLTPRFAISEDLAAGLGRYELVMKNRDAVKNENDMYDLIRRVSYSKIYDPLHCEFDVRSEYVAARDYITTEIITDPSLAEYVYEWLLEKREKYIKKSRQELQDEGKEWESTFTEVVNCNDRTWKIRFFEDENKVVNMSFK